MTRARVRSTSGKVFDREAKCPLSGTSCRSDRSSISPSSFPRFPASRSSRRLRAQNAFVQTGGGFSRSAPSAGTPRELSAKRQYALHRRLSIHPRSPGVTPSPGLS